MKRILIEREIQGDIGGILAGWGSNPRDTLDMKIDWCIVKAGENSENQDKEKSGRKYNYEPPHSFLQFKLLRGNRLNK